MSMRVLVLNYEFPPLGGGAANATKYILKEFSKYKGLKIDLVTSSVGGFKVEKFSNNITIHYLDIGKKPENLHSQSNRDLLTYSWEVYFYCKKLMKEKEFDFCHAFFGIPCGFIARRLGLPYIVSLRGSDVPFYSEKYKVLDVLFFKRMSRKIWRDAKFVIANSNGLRELALESSPKQEIGVVYNGIDVEEFFAKKSYFSGKKLRILCVGRLIERKGFRYVIDAALTVSDKVSLSFAGDGPLREELEKMSEGLDVRFLGIIKHDELSKVYREHDVFVLPSFNEGMSNTVLEAMGTSLALILTDTGGTKEVFDGNGFIVKMRDSSQIASCLKKYLKDKGLVGRHGRKSRLIAENLSWENVAKDYYSFYEKVLEGHKKSNAE